jgi:hypothetical protein
MTAETPLMTQLSADEIRDFVGDNLPPGFAEKQPQNPQKRICFGLLSYDAKVFTRTMMCLVQGIMQCASRGWGASFILRESDSMVARGRSFLASQFLENPDSKNCTDLVMIDLDLEWKGDELVRLCSHEVDVVGGAYPYKDESGDFPLRWPSDGLFEQNGLWQVQAVTPGFFRVTRKALEAIARDMPWLEFKDRGNGEGQRSWMFFDNLQRPTGIYDEGYVFCERARQAGYKIHLDPDLNLTHIGLKAYNHGTLRDWLHKKSANFEKLESEFPGVPPLVLMNKVMGAKIDLEAEAAKAAEAAGAA